MRQRSTVLGRQLRLANWRARLSPVFGEPSDKENRCLQSYLVSTTRDLHLRDQALELISRLAREAALKVELAWHFR